MEKSLIARRFTKAIPHYNAAATVQREIAQKMLQLLQQHAPQSLPHIAEFGCGTGIYSRLLLDRYAPETLWLNDLCPAVAPIFAQWENPAVHFVAGDAETQPLPAAQNLITGCSAVQWFEHPQTFFERCRQSLCAGGILAFNSFGMGTFREIRALTGQGLPYRTAEEYAAMLSPHFELLAIETETRQLSFANAADVLRHLRQTGVTGTAHYAWTRRSLDDFRRRYEQQFSNPTGGVTLTYEPIYVVARTSKSGELAVDG